MPNTYKNKFNKKYGFEPDKSHNLAEISKLTGYKKTGLQTIFDKGVGAFKTNRSAVRPSVKSADQWGQARVYASIDKNSKAYQIDKTHLIKK